MIVLQSFAFMVIHIAIYRQTNGQSGREMKRTEILDLALEDCYNKTTVGDQMSG